MGDEALGVAQIVGDLDDLQGVGEGEGALLAAGHVEGQHRAAARHLAHGQLVLGMILAGGIEHAGDFRARGEIIGDRHGVALLLAQTHRQGLQPLQHDPCVEGREGGTGLPQEVVHMGLDELVRGQNHPAQTAPLPVDMFRGGIDHAIGAHLQRALQQRRGEDIVHHEIGAARMGDLRHRSDVDDFELWIGGAFQKADLGVWLHGGAPLVEIRSIDQRRGHAEAGQQLFDDVAAGAEQSLGRDHMVARFQLAQHGGGDGGHAAGGGAGGLGALQQGHALFEHGDGGIGEARIDEARRLAFEARLGSLHVGIDIALGEEHGLGGLAELRAHGPAMHEPGRGAQLVHGFGGFRGRVFSARHLRSSIGERSSHDDSPAF